MAGPPVSGLCNFPSSYAKSSSIHICFPHSLNVNDDDGYEPHYCIPDFKVRHFMRDATFSFLSTPFCLGMAFRQVQS
jgi:hypothetical protein